MYEQALRGQERVLGPDHQDTLSTLYNLAAVHRDMGNLQEAKKMCERALRGFERVLGPDHQNTKLASNLMSTITSMLPTAIESVKAPSDMSVKELIAAIRAADMSSKAVGLSEKSELVALLDSHHRSA